MYGAAAQITFSNVFFCSGFIFKNALSRFIAAYFLRPAPPPLVRPPPPVAPPKEEGREDVLLEEDEEEDGRDV